MMPISDSRDRFFYPHHTPMNDTYNLTKGDSIIISASLRVAEYTIGFCLETPKNPKCSRCMEMVGFRHVHSVQ